MTDKEQVRKCKSAIKVLEKIANGIDVPFATRITACQYAIEVLCRPDPNNPTNAKNT